MLGTHQFATVIDDPAQPGEKVLHVRATGASEHMHNHAETTLKSGGSYVSIASANTYSISFRAKWLSGSNQLNSRLYFNRLARTTLLPVPAHGGTPGAPNSRLQPNIGPTFRGLQHSPAVPAVGETATISVLAEDADGLSSLALLYSVNGAGFLSVPMVQQGGIYRATVPAQAAGAKVQFYVRGVDNLGAESFFPSGGPASRALIPWNDGQANLDNARPNNLRIVMTAADANFMHTSTNVMSNHRMLSTVIYNEREVYYDVGVRLKSSERGRDQPGRVGFNLRFSADRLFLGSHQQVAVDRSTESEILVKHAINHAGGYSRDV
jgi:hypothetical protein